MKKGILLLLAACVGVFASAQKVYFLYLQTDDQVPFYVRLGDKIHSSASSGFLILPNLTDSNYTLGIGFPKSSEPEAKFSVSVNQNDKGFIIKRFEEGLSLFNFGDMSIVKSNTAQKDNTAYETKTDQFSNILSKAAGDPSIVKVPVVKKEESKAAPEIKEVVKVKTEAEKPVEKSTTIDLAVPQTETVTGTKSTQEAPPVNNSTVVENAVVKPELKQETTVQEPAQVKDETSVQETVYKLSVVRRRSESSTTEGFGVTYHDKNESGTDTIRILIPSSKIKLVSEIEAAPSSEVTSKLESKASLPETTKEVVGTRDAKSHNNSSAQSIAACHNTASEKDFLKLRKKMVSKENDDAMIDEARREFKNKCFTVEQIRYLSTLFLTSAAKYQFFDAAFVRVADKNNFASLGAEIKDDYYAKRFKALIGE